MERVPIAVATYRWAGPEQEMIIVSTMESPLGCHYQQGLRAIAE